MNELVNTIREKTEFRLHDDVVKKLFDAYCNYGILDSVSQILSEVPQRVLEPIIHTLGSHVTKEKPVFTYSVLQSVGQDKKTSVQVGAIVDLLWTLSLMYDDMFDQDLKRSGLPAAWVEFGSDFAYQSAQAGFEAVKKMVSRYFCDDASQVIDKLVVMGIGSLKAHRDLKPGASKSELLDNYRLRALFHTALPFVLIDQVPDDKNVSFLAIENVNLAGQIMNDLKDVSPKYIWLREGFSDIRSGVMSIPLAILIERLNTEDKTRTLGLFGNGEMSEIDKRFVIDSFVTSGTLADSINMTKEIYNASLDQFHSVLKPEFRIFIDEWILSKKQQLDNLV
ncbi:MAG: hypothetical protein UW68_C0017G0007 [Candidatus Collierbacteria bacterium GW2011_GWB1_44_6]|uniref:Polyprenyl synthetase n=2 Tax=Candidatus Collieribacteriota TaxID=1752725 RepID=A0A0G1LW75_9BACT|nr:MAG: hypothetical protein UV68_C0002G0023 [Candidatus Collierbacteria bacterium GW2011_GWC2_43_12]KKT73072.1 MAG: hypothetical protein UW68_C0017G0007 [Candidatus Collierbacteria bacterium GW2011_GWB1_44_6]KKT83207.1 MAG: hypothetical protein UW80_C0019G0017 [Microgenomates group bacterium GW2011_GWC1_44_9]